ncbi:MAG: hypothetical protein ACYC66_02910 [Chloroflexota bacterium]
MRRIGELLLKGVYLWLEASGDAEAGGESLGEAAVEARAMGTQSQSTTRTAGSGYFPEGRDGFSRRHWPRSSDRGKSRTRLAEPRSVVERLKAMG